MAIPLILKKIFDAGLVTEPAPGPDDNLRMREQSLHAELLRVFGQAVAVRHVDAGSCNGCELEIHALNGPHYNLEGAGIRFVASPRHADLLLVTGPVSRHLLTAIRRTWAAVPDPKWVVAVGDCGCRGGLFGENYATCGSVSSVLPVDVEIPGCPPEPARLLQAILTAVSAGPARNDTAKSD